MALPATLPGRTGQVLDPLLPRRFAVAERRVDSDDTVTLLLTAADGRGLDFAPGQFTMIGVAGVGEVPISVSGDPARPEVLEHTVRDVGVVTHVIARLEPGDRVGVRGPYGTGWEVADGAGGDVVLVAGGIGLAPLAPAVDAVVARRGDYRRVVVLAGARSPQDLLFAERIAAWRAADVEVVPTVDHATPGYHGRVGLVTDAVPHAGFDARHTLALVCGPEAMMIAAATALTRRGVPADRVRISMERSMTCGVGLCGHCQLRELVICVDGPVLPWSRVAPLLEVREL